MTTEEADRHRERRLIDAERGGFGTEVSPIFPAALVLEVGDAAALDEHWRFAVVCGL